MIDKFFNIYLFEKEKIKNKSFLNESEILNQFSYINFDTIYMDIDAIIGDLIFDKKEIHQNVNHSVLFHFLKQMKSFNLGLIYNGYILKSILFTILKGFSTRRIPFKTLYNIKNWTNTNGIKNEKLKKELDEQKKHEININDFSIIFQDIIMFFSSDIPYTFEVDILYRFVYHYYQTIIPITEFKYVIDIENKLKIKFELTKKISKTIKINIPIIKQIFDIVSYNLDVLSNNNGDFKQFKKKWSSIEKKVDSILGGYNYDVIYEDIVTDFEQIETPALNNNLYKISESYNYEILNNGKFDKNKKRSIIKRKRELDLVNSLDQDNHKTNLLVDNDDYGDFFYGEDSKHSN